jgi:hypothetical protein
MTFGTRFSIFEVVEAAEVEPASGRPRRELYR